MSTDRDRSHHSHGYFPRNPQAAPVETRLYYAEYRDVNGVRWPFRIRQSVGGATVEETTFDRYRINPKIDPKRFASGR